MLFVLVPCSCGSQPTIGTDSWNGKTYEICCFNCYDVDFDGERYVARGFVAIGARLDETIDEWNQRIYERGA